MSGSGGNENWNLTQELVQRAIKLNNNQEASSFIIETQRPKQCSIYSNTVLDVSFVSC